MNKCQVLKKVVLHENTRKSIQILLKFHFETIEPLIRFIINQLNFLKNFGMIKKKKKKLLKLIIK